MFDDNTFFKKIRLKNFLSYGEEGVELECQPLNVFIGPNAAGKSNLIEAFRIMKAAAYDMTEKLNVSEIIRQGGGITEWIWKGKTDNPISSIDVFTKNPKDETFIHYVLMFRRSARNIYELFDETIRIADSNFVDISQDWANNQGRPALKSYIQDSKEMEEISKEPWKFNHARVDELDLSKSILAQRKDPQRFPTVSALVDYFSNVRIYRDINVGLNSPIRQYQPSESDQNFLLEDASNLALVINNLEKDTDTGNLLYEYLKRFYKYFDRITMDFKGGILINLHELNLDGSVSAKRLSDGILHYLCLLAILLHPEPPPVVCIEEPELCMHPKIISTIGELLVNASKRTQLFVTTHSSTLVSALTDYPDSIVVCERDEKGSHLKRLEKERLEKWLELYSSLGTLWRMGEIGGNP